EQTQTPPPPQGPRKGGVLPPQNPPPLPPQCSSVSECTGNPSLPDCPESRLTAEWTPPRSGSTPHTDPCAAAPDGAGTVTTTRTGRTPAHSGARLRRRLHARRRLRADYHP